MLKIIALTTALLAGASGLAIAQQMQMPGMNHRANPADQDFAAGMTKMNDAMAAAPMAGNPDGDFVGMMIPHHQGAVAMAETELKYGKDPELRQMARDIIAAQDKEIAQMKHWQAAHKS
jgi:uncharacterized protein (DUF305 family)